MQLLSALAEEFNNTSNVYDSRSITNQCAHLRGMDANKTQLPTTNWADWDGAKPHNKVKGMRPVLTVVHQNHTASSCNDGDDIWKFVEDRSRPGVPEKAVGYWMYVMRDDAFNLMDTLVRLLPPRMPFMMVAEMQRSRLAPTRAKTVASTRVPFA